MKFKFWEITLFYSGHFLIALQFSLVWRLYIIENTIYLTFSIICSTNIDWFGQILIILYCLYFEQLTHNFYYVYLVLMTRKYERAMLPVFSYIERDFHEITLVVCRISLPEKNSVERMLFVELNDEKFR